MITSQRGEGGLRGVDGGVTVQLSAGVHVA